MSRHQQTRPAALAGQPSHRSAPGRYPPAGSCLRLVAGTILIATAALLGACAGSDTARSGIFSPHRIDLPQGNYVTGEMLERVKPGMSPEQVRFALGSPLVVDIFRPQQWNYVFRYLHANGTAELRRVVIVFADDRVARIDADPLPETEDQSDPALPGYRGPGGA